jgi:hypothetical protein
MVIKESGNKLNGARIFLSGPIDRVADDGVVWRKHLKDTCDLSKLNFSFFDPCDKPKGLGSEIGIEKHKMKELIGNGEWETAQKFAKKFRRYDLRGVDWCDLLISKIDLNTHMCGTYDEIFTAEREQKPIFMIMGEGQSKKDIPAWLVSFMKEEEIFENENECVKYLLDLNDGTIDLDRRWVKMP